MEHVSSERIFNQYRERVPPIDGRPSLDKEDAPAIRRNNLRLYLEEMKMRRPASLWVFEAPSKSGALRTGVPLTSERDFKPTSKHLDIAKQFEKATSEDVSPSEPSETSEIVWDEVGRCRSIPLLWNCVMLRPFDDSIACTRNPGTIELRAHAPILEMLIRMFNPKLILWAGERSRKMSTILGQNGIEADHPKSRRGSNFRAQTQKFRNL